MAERFIHYTKAKLEEILNDFPESPTNTTCQHTIHQWARLIAQHLHHKQPQDLVDDHARDAVFTDGALPTTNNISRGFWAANDICQRGALVRSILSIGPASLYCPAFYTRCQQGILCQPSYKNHDKTPIQFLMAHYLQEVKVCDIRSTDYEKVMADLVELFTSTDDIQCGTLNTLTIHFVKGTNNPVDLPGTRLDIIYALRLAYIIGYITFLSNPTDFKHYHPLLVIQKIFTHQSGNFFPNKDLSAPLTDVEKDNYLFTLSVKVWQKMSKHLDGAFYLYNAELFPSSTPMTDMPVPLAIGYRPEKETAFEPIFFLFGEKTEEGAADVDYSNIVAQPLDPDMLECYMAPHNTSVSGLRNLITMICPKKDLRLSSTKDLGFKRKDAMLKHLMMHMQDFHDTHQLDSYIKELETCVP